jgi:hypothetical protein
MLLSAIIFAIIIGTILIERSELHKEAPDQLVPVRIERRRKHRSADK